jgi:hypothetical protein
VTRRPLDEVLREAPLVFRGRVESDHASSTATYSASDQTAVVEVQEVIRAPEALAQLAGLRVTVVLQTPGEPAVGDTAVFYTHTLVVADSLVVQEVDHEPTVEGALPVEGLADALVKSANEPVQARLDQADVVILGTVTKVEPSTVAGPPTISEHDPLWWDAEVHVEQVLKGDLKSDTVTVLYPSSFDVAWYAAPKYHEGQRGIFALHSDETTRAAAAERGEVYMTLDANDFHAAEDEGRIRSLLPEERPT